jgi:hypothetical protein
MNSFAGSEAPPINYDCSALVEVEVDDVQYRLDAGKQGTALCISTREPGSYDWTFLSEARWDGRHLRVKALDRTILIQLSKALREVTEASE